MVIVIVSQGIILLYVVMVGMALPHNDIIGLVHRRLWY